MITKVRVDFRLVHGQIIHSWLKATDSDTICILDDLLLENPLKKQLLYACTPRYVHLEIFPMKEGLAFLRKHGEERHFLLLVEQISSGIHVCQQLSIRQLNIGETVYDPLKKKLANSVYASVDEIELMNQFLSQGNSIEIQQLANSKRLLFNDKKLFML